MSQVEHRAPVDRAVVPARRRPRWPGMVLHVALLVLVVRFLVWPQVGSSDHSLAMLMSVRRPWLALAMVAELLSLVCAVAVTYAVLPARVRPSLLRVARIDLSAIALGHVVPDGGAAGTALSWRMLVRNGVPSTTALTAKVAQGVWSALALQVLVLGGLGFGALTGTLDRWSVVAAAGSVSVIGVLTMLWLSLRRPAVRLRLQHAVRRLPRVGTALATGLGNLETAEVVVHLRSVLASPGRRHALAALSMGNWLLDAFALWAGLHAYGARLGFAVLVTAYALQVLGSWIPITPGGLGVAESMMIPALVAGGVGAGAAAFGILAWRLVAYWAPIPIGAAAYAWHALDPPEPAAP